MTNTSAFYLARADDAAREAGKTSLENVRERHLQSEAAWRAMAARLQQGEEMKLASAALKKGEAA